MATRTPVKMPGTPKPWMNAAMRAALRTPGVRQLLGRAFAIITVTGARTGTRYSTPVQYMDVDGRYVVLSQTMRTWWRNIRTRPDVELLVAGEAIDGTAVVAEGGDARDLLTRCLTENPRVAKFYGVEVDARHPVDPAAVDALLERVVVIAISRHRPVES
jgi:deazaflavin-dependent oxidoreductase (nitroreductase family)